METEKRNALALIDANSIVNRAFYAMTYLTTDDGTPIGAVYGFTAMLISLMEKYKTESVVAAFDMRAPTFRHKMYDGYKGKRKGMPDELACQLAPLKELLAAANIPVVECEGFEADDIIGTLAKSSDRPVYILTGDRDSFQLVDDKISVLMTRKGLSEIEEITPKSLAENYHLTPSGVIDYKAIAGDSSDNIPGVRGIGDKGALSLLNDYGTLDGIYENIDKIGGKLKEKLLADKEAAYLSYKLATIDTAAPIDTSVTQAKIAFPFSDDVKRKFAAYKFNSLLKRAELFGGEAALTNQTAQAEVRTEEVIPLTMPTASGSAIALAIIGGKLHFAFDGTVDYVCEVADGAAFFDKYGEALKRGAVCYDLKSLYTALDGYSGFFEFPAFDCYVALYLTERRAEPASAAELFALEESLKKQIEDLGMQELYYEIEQPLITVLYEMERFGFLVNRDTLNQLNASYQAEEKSLVEEVWRLSGKEFNVNSPKQLAKVLFEDLAIPYPGKPPYSTGKEILEKLVGENDVIDAVLRFRFVSKMRATFVEGMLRAAKADGSVHTHFNQTVTSTGRLSSTEPNLQNIPVRTEEGKFLRSIFCAREGYVLVDADYSQIELKLLAHFSGEPVLIDAFRAGEDIHTVTACTVFGVSKEDVTPDLRRMAKAVNFGTVYGISGYGLSQNVHISPKKAEEFLKRYFQKYPKVKEYLDELVSRAKACGYAETLFNRRRRIPELVSGKFTERRFGERVAKNMPLQGTAADIIKIAMVKVRNSLIGLDARLVLQIHDELIVEAKEEIADKVKEILREQMEGAVSLNVPLNVDIGVGKTWADCK